MDPEPGHTPHPADLTHTVRAQTTSKEKIPILTAVGGYSLAYQAALSVSRIACVERTILESWMTHEKAHRVVIEETYENGVLVSAANGRSLPGGVPPRPITARSAVRCSGRPSRSRRSRIPAK